MLLFQSERGGKPKVESLGKSEFFRVLCSINLLLFGLYTDEADTSSTHDFFKKLPDTDIEKDEEVSV